jgi:excinuclease ABC subunit C
MSRKQNFARVGLEDQDYFHYYRDGEEGILQLFQTRGGQVVARREFSFTGSGSEPDAEVLGHALQQYYESEPEVPGEVYVPIELVDRPLIESWLGERRGGRVSVRVPVRGVKAAFLTTVRTNAELAFRTRFRSPVTTGVAALEALREALDLDEPPYRIEGFDISHLQGTHVVASLVVWVGGRPRKGEYRRFKVRTVAGQDDFASLAEVVERRYRRRLAEGAPLPDLLLIDGGRGQLAASHRGLVASGSPPIPMVALAKREEELFLLGRDEPLRLPPASPALRLLQQVRDESHRFAVGYHRQIRSKQAVRSALVEIPGVGPRSVVTLLRAFGSVRELRKAGAAQMAEHVAPRIARAVRAYFDAVGSTQTPPAG